MAFFCIPINSENRIEMILNILYDGYSVAHKHNDRVFIDSCDKIKHYIIGSNGNTVHNLQEVFFEIETHQITDLISELLHKENGANLRDFLISRNFITAWLMSYRVDDIGENEFLGLISPESQQEFNLFELFSRYPMPGKDVFDLSNRLFHSKPRYSVSCLYYKLANQQYGFIPMSKFLYHHPELMI